MPTVVNESTKLVELTGKLTTELVTFQNKINHGKTCLIFTVTPHHHYGMVRLRVLQIWKIASINSIINTHNWWLVAGYKRPCYKTLQRVLTSNLDLANTGWGKRHLTRPVCCWTSSVQCLLRHPVRSTFYIICNIKPVPPDLTHYSAWIIVQLLNIQQFHWV